MPSNRLFKNASSEEKKRDLYVYAALIISAALLVMIAQGIALYHVLR